MQNNQTALITGATGGLGIQLCREFARHGYDLVVTARDPRRLEKLAAWLRETWGGSVTDIAMDLNQPNAPKLLYDKIRAANIHIDVLVNNAGFAHGGRFENNRPRIQDAMLRVNMQAPTRLCRLFLPGMLEAGRGGILNVASIGSFVPGPYNSVYCATKAYLLSLTEALASELSGTPLTITALCPGAMDTGFAGRARMENTRLFHYGVMHPRKAARAAYRAFAAGERLVLPGGMTKAMAFAIRLLPRRAVAAASGFIQKQHAAR